MCYQTSESGFAKQIHTNFIFYPIINENFFTEFAIFCVPLRYNYNSYQEILIFAKRFSVCISNHKSFKIRLFALSTTLVSSDAR